MLFYEFAQIMYAHSGYESQKAIYISELFDHFVSDSKYNLFSNLEIDTLSRHYNSNYSISKDKIQKAFSHKDIHRFANYISLLSPSNQEGLEKSLSQEIPNFNPEESLGYACADLFSQILENILRPKTKNRKKLSPLSSPIKSVYYTEEDRKLHLIGGIEIELPEILIPEQLDPIEAPYTTALLEAYASDSEKILSSLPFEELPPKYLRNFTDHRINFYSASRIERFAREHSDLDSEAEHWKNQTFDYIKDTLWDDYDNGYKRLNAVMKKVVDCSTISVLDDIQSFITPRDKKGVCHLMVNQGKLKWVEDYD
jgi:hypothetical protein